MPHTRCSNIWRLNCLFVDCFYPPAWCASKQSWFSLDLAVLIESLTLASKVKTCLLMYLITTSYVKHPIWQKVTKTLFFSYTSISKWGGKPYRKIMIKLSISLLSTWNENHNLIWHYFVFGCHFCCLLQCTVSTSS